LYPIIIEEISDEIKQLPLVARAPLRFNLIKVTEGKLNRLSSEIMEILLNIKQLVEQGALTPYPVTNA